jgi:hypothetical protein
LTASPRYLIHSVAPEDGEKAVTHRRGNVSQAEVINAGDFGSLAFDFPSQFPGGEAGALAELLNGLVAVEPEIKHGYDSRIKKFSDSLYQILMNFRYPFYFFEIGGKGRFLPGSRNLYPDGE